MVRGFRPRVEHKTPAQLALMRRSGLLLARVHAAIQEAIAPGVSTADLDRVAAAVIADGGGHSNFLGYHGFPAHICVSVNEEIVHGIPGSRVLREGDVVSVDAGCVVEGWHSDAARTHIVGQARSEQELRLVEVARKSMWVGIAALAASQRVGDVGAAIEDFVESAVGEEFQFLEDFGGHGIGRAMHEPPDVMNFRTRDRGPRIKPGLAVAIEPMLVIGDADYRILDDEWTVVSASGKTGVHWENSVAVTEAGIFVLTEPDGGQAALSALGVDIAPEPK